MMTKSTNPKFGATHGRAERMQTSSLVKEQTARRKPLATIMLIRALENLEFGKLTVCFPDDESVEFVGKHPGPEATLVLQNHRLPAKIVAEGSIGVGESYMNGDWHSHDMPALMDLFTKNENLGNSLTSPNKFWGLFFRVLHWYNTNSRRGARKNIAAHYDLGNDFYAKWLDETMTYSSGIFDRNANSLKQSQKNKYTSLAQSMGIKPDDHVLEIGCGWGGFAEFAASEIGCKITALTISEKQYDFARKRIFEAGLAEKVEIRLQDYRDETNRYDRIASIEMFEAVGEKYWQTYFGKLKECLHKGGTAGLQIITIADEFFSDYSRRPDFIQRYIFPGGMLPSPAELEKLRSDVGMTLLNQHVFPQDYAKTLAEWRRRFLSKWNDIRQLGFDERFKRMWEFYLYYCEAGFKSEQIDVRQIFYQK